MFARVTLLLRADVETQSPPPQARADAGRRFLTGLGDHRQPLGGHAVVRRGNAYCRPAAPEGIEHGHPDRIETLLRLADCLRPALLPHLLKLDAKLIGVRNRSSGKPLEYALADVGRAEGEKDLAGAGAMERDPSPC